MTGVQIVKFRGGSVVHQSKVSTRMCGVTKHIFDRRKLELFDERVWRTNVIFYKTRGKISYLQATMECSICRVNTNARNIKPNHRISYFLQS